MPHFTQFILRNEAMTAADRRLADEQMGRMAQQLWLVRRSVAERWRAVVGRGPAKPEPEQVCGCPAVREAATEAR